MIDFMNSVFGQYTPNTYTVITSDGAIQTIIPAGLSGVDFRYVGSVFIFGIFLYCILRIVGSLFSRS